MSRLLASELIPCIDAVRVFSDGSFSCLNDYLIDFINNNDLVEGINNVDGLFCELIEFNSYSCYNFCFVNRPDISLTLFYGSNLSDSLAVVGEDSFYADNLILCYDTFICKDSFLVLHNIDFFNVKRFYDKLDVVREGLYDLLVTKGSLSFLDSVIDELGVSKVIAYEMIAEACDFFIKNNYLTK